MKTIDLIEDLTYSVLKNIGSGQFDENSGHNRNGQILSFINRAMIRIYSDLKISQNISKIKVIKNKNIYDLPEDFISEIMVYDENTNEIPISKDDRHDSVYFNEPFKIYIPEVLLDKEINILYIKSPARLSGSSEEILPLNSQFIEALILYIAYISYEMINPAPRYAHQSLLTKYKEEILRLNTEGLNHTSHTVNYKLALKGYK